MPTAMELLINLVRAQIQDRDGIVFSKSKPATETEPAQPDELEAFVTLAIQDYSRWRPLKGKPATLQIEAGKLDYSLPADFVDMEYYPTVDYRVFQKTLFIVGGAPSEPIIVDYLYTAMHTADTLPEYDKPAVVDFASAKAMRAIIADPNRLEAYTSYELKDVLQVNGENMTELGKELLKSASDLEKQYLLRVQPGQTVPSPTAYMSFG